MSEKTLEERASEAKTIADWFVIYDDPDNNSDLKKQAKAGIKKLADEATTLTLEEWEDVYLVADTGSDLIQRAWNEIYKIMTEDI